MKELYLALIFTFVNCYPVFRSYPDVSDSTVKTKIAYHSLDNNVMFAWKLINDELLISIKFPIEYRWMVLSFKAQDQDTVSTVDEMAWLRVKSSGLAVGNANWDADAGFTKSTLELWEKVKATYDEERYRVTLRRPLDGLKWKEPLKMVYGYGDDGRIPDINEAFSNNYKIINIDLTSQQSFNVSKHKSIVNGNTIDKPVFTTVQPKVESTAISPSSTIKTTTIKTTGKVLTVPNNVKLINQNPTKEHIAEHSKAAEHDAHAQYTPTTPCPTPKCNCTQDNSHWYDILREKQNTIYFAIIGGCALFTGIIVLCIACCCARGKPGVPRTRKHKVAFYKVDDFDSSDADEEMEFIDKAKEAKYTT